MNLLTRRWPEEIRPPLALPELAFTGECFILIDKIKENVVYSDYEIREKGQRTTGNDIEKIFDVSNFDIFMRSNGGVWKQLCE